MAFYKLLKALAVVTILTCSVSVYSQPFQVSSSRIDTKDLLQNVSSTQEGFYWYSNSSGLYRFDGSNIKHFPVVDKSSSVLHDQFVSSDLFEDEDGVFWFTTYEAIHSFQPLTNIFKTYNAPQFDENGKGYYIAFHFDEIRQDLILKIGKSIYAYNVESQLFRLLLKESVGNSYHLLIQEDGVQVFGAPWWNADGMEYFYYQEGGVHEYRKIDLPIMVKSIASYNSDSLYLATPEGLYLLTRPLDPIRKRLTLKISGVARHTTLEPVTSNVFVSIDPSGVYQYSPTQDTVTGHWSKTNGLMGNDPRYLLPDGKGNIFINHTSKGSDILTVSLGGIDFTPHVHVSPIVDIAGLEGGKVMWLSEDGEIFIKDHSRSKYSISQQTSGNLIHNGQIEVTPTGELWVHSKFGLTQISPSGLIMNHQPLPSSIYRDVLTLDNQMHLVLSESGILSVQEDSLRLVSSISSDSDDYFTVLSRLSDSSFFANYRRNQIWLIDHMSGEISVKARIHVPGETQTALLSNDTLYAGTSAGLLTIVDTNIISTFNPTSTTGNLWINALHQDAQNRLWLGTEQGLFCYYPNTGEHLYFSEADGIPDDWFIRANVIANDSTFTMATKTGLVTVDTRIADEKLSDNKTYLSDIWVNGIRDTDHSLYAPQPLDLDFQHNAVSFLPGMIELSSSSLSGFRYRLLGLEDAYTYSKAGEVIRYPSIPPGSYTFEFVGVDKNGRNTKPFMLPVKISPPFYQTWWFWALCGTVFIGLFYSLNRRAIQKETARQQAIQKEEARKAEEKLARHQAVVSEQRRIMMELHDDLGGTLGTLFYTLDGYLLDKESGLPVAPDLELLKNTSSDAMKQLREVMKNNVARELPLPIFVRTLTEQARAVTQASKLTWKLERDDVFPETKLSGRQVHNALLIVKEALQNIRKHAKAASFTLKLQLEGETSETFSIKLTDDGIGLKESNDDQRTDGTGNGLLNMQRRAEDLGGTLTVEHPTSGGTSLQLRFPLEE